MPWHFIWMLIRGLTLRFQARARKRPFDIKLVIKNRISGYFSGPYPGENKHVKTCFKHVLTCLKKHVFLGITCFNINVKWPTNIIL